MASKQERLAQLTGLFRAAGARNPEGWARSEVEEGFAQLGRFLFLRGAWKGIVPDDPSWIDAWLRGSPDPDAPLGGVKPALERLLAAGADRRDLTEVVRASQYELLFHICYLLGDSAAAIEDLDDPTGELASIGWGLFELSDDDEIGRPIDMLHESCLDTDPTGREMRPARR